ncbi:ANTAR domain-containing protein [Kocuria sp. CPCC 205258]|uniref:ANTAR domain-containing protein n=1 Tax=Kocuria sp. CPCC 205258 TaxID=3073552 RepID=UPI0034D479C0
MLFDLDGEVAAELNVYADPADTHAEAIIKVVQAHVAQASTILRLVRHRDTVADLAAAMASRTTIDLAVGIIMEQNPCLQQEVVEILKAVSSHRNSKLRGLATELVNTVGRGLATAHFDA